MTSDDADWIVNFTETIPFRIEIAMTGKTEACRHFQVEERFKNFRFPFVNIEWFVETPYHEIEKLRGLYPVTTSITVFTSWRMWAQQGRFSGRCSTDVGVLQAYGDHHV